MLQKTYVRLVSWVMKSESNSTKYDFATIEHTNNLVARGSVRPYLEKLWNESQYFQPIPVDASDSPC